MEVRPRGDRLVITGVNQPDTPLVFYGPDVAYALDGSYLGTPYEFIRASDGAVRWIRLNGRIARKQARSTSRLRLRLLSLVLAAAVVAVPSARQQPVVEAPNPVRAGVHQVRAPGGRCATA